MEAGGRDGGGGSRELGGLLVPSTALLSCSQPVSPPPAASSSGPDPGHHPGVARFSCPGAWEGSSAAAPADPRGQRFPISPKPLQGTQDGMESRAKSPQPPRSATCGGDGGAAGGRRGREGGRNPAGCSGKGGSDPGRAETGWGRAPRRGDCGAIRGPAEGRREAGRERRPYLCPDGRHAAGGAERRGRAAAAALYVPGGRRAAESGSPRPPRPRGRGALRAPPRLSQQRGPDGRSRAGPNRAEQRGEERGCTPAALARGSGSPQARCRARPPGRRCPGPWRCLSPRCSLAPCPRCPRCLRLPEGSGCAPATRTVCGGAAAAKRWWRGRLPQPCPLGRERLWGCSDGRR